jgi:hypothetical protein
MVLALNIHAGYECRHSGACCTAGWPIAVEPGPAARIRSDRRLPPIALGTSDPLSEDAAAIIQPGAGGACPFFEPAAGRLCAVQRLLGHESLPSACRHFPRVALLEPDAIRVTLSHFCPTAAWMLFRSDVGAPAVVADAAGISDRADHEGFDARQTIPPFLRPGVATDPDTCRAWEAYLVGALDTSGETPEDALARVADTADRIRAWNAKYAALSDHASRVIEAETTEPPARPSTMSAASAARLFERAAASVPEGLARPVMPIGCESADRALIQSRWNGLGRPVRRYLGARAFAAWSAYLGQGLRSQVAMLSVALAVVRVEAARHAAAASRPLDEPILHAAIRSADLLLQHLSNPGILMRSLAGVEGVAPGAFLDTIGLEKAG